MRRMEIYDKRISIDQWPQVIEKYNFQMPMIDHIIRMRLIIPNDFKANHRPIIIDSYKFHWYFDSRICVWFRPASCWLCMKKGKRQMNQIITNNWASIICGISFCLFKFNRVCLRLDNDIMLIESLISGSSWNVKMI